MISDDKLKMGVGITGVICVTTLQSIAMVTGVDGNYFGIATALIGGIVGAALGITLKKTNKTADNT